MRKFRLKVELLGFEEDVYRVIEASENCNFNDLHNVIFDAFERFEEHLYSFFMTYKDTNNLQKIYKSKSIVHPMELNGGIDMEMYAEKPRSSHNTRLGDVDLKEKDVFFYLFDYGDDWWHRVTVEGIEETSGKRKSIKLVESVGDSPPQYEDMEDDEYYDDEYYDDDDDEEDDEKDE